MSNSDDDCIIIEDSYEAAKENAAPKQQNEYRRTDADEDSCEPRSQSTASARNAYIIRRPERGSSQDSVALVDLAQSQSLSSGSNHRQIGRKTGGRKTRSLASSNAKHREHSRVGDAAISSGAIVAPLAKRTRQNKRKESGEDSEYEIDEILAHGYNERHKQMEFLVHWTGYAPTDNTWQLESTMKSSQLIDEYWERKRHDARVDMQSLPEREARARIANALSSTINCQGYKVHSVRPSETTLNRLIVEIDYEPEIHKFNLDAILKRTLEEWNSVCKQSGIAPLRLVNNVDLVCTFEVVVDELSLSCELSAYLPPPQMKFIARNIYHEHKVRERALQEPIFYCSCETCDDESDCCPKNQVLHEVPFGWPSAYTEDGRLRECIEWDEMRRRKIRPQKNDAIYKKVRMPIVECNMRCACEKRGGCKERIVQRGRQIVLEIRRTEKAGYGIFATSDIACGSFVEEYCGEVVHREEMNRRDKEMEECDISYLFDLDFDTSDSGEPEFTIDAKEYGNAARFINHSCTPNLIVRSVWTNGTSDRDFYRLALFAQRDIRRGEQLTFDYSYAMYYVEESATRRDKRRHVMNDARMAPPEKCYCRAAPCRGYMY